MKPHCAYRRRSAVRDKKLNSMTRRALELRDIHPRPVEIVCKHVNSGLRRGTPERRAYRPANTSQATGSQSVASLRPPDGIWHAAGVVSGGAVIDEERRAAHGAGVRVCEPFRDAGFAEGVLTGGLDGGVHGLCEADGACIVRALHWCQTSVEKGGSGGESHGCSAADGEWREVPLGSLLSPVGGLVSRNRSF